MIFADHLSSTLAQAPDWIEGLIFLAIVVFSVIGSMGKWIVQKIEERRKQQEASREGLTLDGPPKRPQPPLRRPLARDPRTATPPSPIPTGRPLGESPAPPRQPPVLERVFEVLVEQATGQKLDRGERTRQPRRPPPPPAKPARQDRQVSSKRRAASPQPAQRPQSMADSSKLRDAAQAARERRPALTMIQPSAGADDTETEIAMIEVFDAFDDPAGLRRAIVLSEILSPPLALRTGSDEHGVSPRW